MRSPVPFTGADILVTESTYGNRKHPDVDPEKVAVLVDAVHQLSKPYHMRSAAG